MDYTKKTKEELIEEIFRLKSKNISIHFDDEDEQKNFHKRIIDSSADPIYVLNGKRLLLVNPAWEKLFGYSAEEATSETFDIFNIVAEESKEKISEKFCINIKEAPVQSRYKMKGKTKKGKIIDLDVNVSKIFWNGDIVYQGIYRDISEIKRTEEALRQEAFIFENLQDALIITDLEGYILSWNNAATKLYGYSRNEAVTNFLSLIIDDLSFEEITKIIFEKGRWSGELKFKKKDGSTGISDTVISPFCDRDGKIIAFVGFYRDITEKKKVEEALKLSDSILQNIRNLVLVANSEGSIIYSSPSVKEILGYNPEEILDDGWWRLTRDDLADIEQQKELTAKAASDKISLNVIPQEIWLRHKNGSLKCLLWKTSRGPKDTILGVGYDITERINAENALRESQERYQKLFDDSPICLWEEDFSEFKKYIDGLKLNGITDFRKYFTENPDEIRKCASLIKIIDVNRLTLQVYEIESKEQLFENLELFYIEDSGQTFREEIIALAEGKTFFEGEGINKSFTGKNIYIYLRCFVVPQYKDTLSKVLVAVVDITKRKQTEKALLDSENKFRKIAEKSLVGVYLIQDEVFKYINPKFAEIFEYEVDEMINIKGPKEISTEESWGLVKNYIGKRLDGSLDSIHYEFVALTKNNRKIVVEVYGSRTEYEDKPAVIGTLLDITERKNSENALKESEQKYRKLISSANDSILIAETETGKIIDANKKAEILLDRKRDEIIGLHQSEIHPKDKKKQYNGLFKTRVSMSEGFSGMEIYVEQKNGKQIPVEVSSSLLTLGGKSIMLGIFRDITDRKQAENQIRKLSQAIEQSPSSIVITNLDGAIEYVNPRFTQLTGYEPEEAIGRNSKFLQSGKTPREVYTDLWAQLEKGKDWRGEFHNKKKNGELYWESASISPIKNADGKITHYLAVKENITEAKALNEELIRAKEKAEESDRLKSEFLAQMSHEIRTPLNVMLSYNSLIKDELSETPSDDLQSAFNSIDSAGKRLLRTIDLILNMAAIQTGYIDVNNTKVDVAKVIVQLIKEFNYTITNQNIELFYKIDADYTQINADDYIVSEIFQNLINNAIKYTPGGKVEVIVYERDDNKLYVDVIDTGIGISEEYLPKLFLPFTQEETGYSRKFEGNGLGLALVKNYIDLLGATISIKSTKGKGSKFTVCFPSLIKESYLKDKL